MRVQVDAAEVDDPRQLGLVTDDDLVGGAAGRVLELDVSIHSGRFSGARFWKNASWSMPFTYRLSAIGRSPTALTAPPATER
jgi:hypothetical protein